MPLPYKVATLLYAFNHSDEVLLLQRAQEPNRGLWSPCGGKLQQDVGESPHGCACREAQEELGLELHPSDLHLTAVVSEDGYLGQAHWLMFLFEIKKRLTTLPPPHREGSFRFIPRHQILSLEIPETDRTHIWPLFWQHRGGFFAAHCHCRDPHSFEWSLLESRPPESCPTHCIP